MQIHQVIDNSTLQVILNPVDDDLLANVHDFEIRVVALISVSIDGLVHFFVVSDAVSEVLRSFFRVLTLVIGTGRLHIPNVGHDYILVVAFALHKQYFDAMLFTCFNNPFTALFGGIGRIQDTNSAAGAEPGQHIRDSSLCGSSSLAFTFWVVVVKEIG